MANLKKITILGIGNLLLKDEGIGIHVIDVLRKEPLPDNVILVDGATAGFDLLPLLNNCDALIVIDAIKTEDAPGTIYKFRPEDIDVQNDAAFSLHDIGFFQMLEWAKLYNKKLPLITMIGIVPQEAVMSMDLSVLIFGKIPQIITLIKEEIETINDMSICS